MRYCLFVVRPWSETRAGGRQGREVSQQIMRVCDPSALSIVSRCMGGNCGKGNAIVEGKSILVLCGHFPVQRVIHSPQVTLV